MVTLLFKCKGLASPYKKLDLRRLIEAEHPNIVLRKETLGDGEAIFLTLQSITLGWLFIGLDVRGRYGGLSIGLNQKYIQSFGSWGFEMVLGVDIFSTELGMELRVINIYGPCQN